MTPKTITTNGRKLLVVSVPKEAHDFIINDAWPLLTYKSPNRLTQITLPGPIQKQSFIGTMHFDEGKPVFDFDTSAYLYNMNFSVPAGHGGVVIHERFVNDHETPDFRTNAYRNSEDALVSTMRSQEIGFIANPMGEEPEDISDLGAFTQYRRKRHQEWQKAEEGVLKPDQQYVFIGVL